MIDHLVYGTPDLERTVADLRSQWDLELVEGGPHLGRGTRNFLAGLGNGSYLEVIGPDFEQKTPKAPRPFGVDDLGEARLVAWCARPNLPLAALVRAVADVGFDMGSVLPMSRRRPDGQVLEWELTVRPGPPHPIVPFCISWGATPHPTLTLTNSTLLSALVLTDPDPVVAHEILDAIGETTRVHHGSRSIAAVLQSPNGELVLT